MSRSSRGCAAMPHALPGENGAADSENVGQGLTALEDAAGPRPRVQIFCGCGRAALLRLRLRPAGPRRFGECRSGMYSFGRRSGSMSHARVLSFSGRGRAAMARAATDGLGYLLARSCGRSRHTYNYNHTSPDTPLRAHARMRARTQKTRTHASTHARKHARMRVRTRTRTYIIHSHAPWDSAATAPAPDRSTSASCAAASAAPRAAMNKGRARGYARNSRAPHARMHLFDTRGPRANGTSDARARANDRSQQRARNV